MILNNDIFCNFIRIDKLNYECSKCGNKITINDEIDEPPIFPCLSPLHHYNSSNIINFMSNHVAEFKDLCDASTIDARHRVCESCVFFQNNTCTECGCSLTRERNYLNKLAVKNESCPLKKW